MTITAAAQFAQPPQELVSTVLRVFPSLHLLRFVRRIFALVPFNSLITGKLMNVRIRCRHALVGAFVSCCTVYFAILVGCSIPKKQSSIGTLSTGKQFKDLRLTYRTESDRLNVTASANLGSTQLVSHQQQSPKLFPNVTTSTLVIQHPHPNGTAGYAQAMVTLRPTGAEKSVGFSFRKRMNGNEEDQASHDAQIIEAWALDIPVWQVFGIMAKLQKEKFFRRTKVPNAEAYLAVRADGGEFGKAYSPVPELDGLILRIRWEGRPVGQPPYRPGQQWHSQFEPSRHSARSASVPTQPGSISTPPAFNNQQRLPAPSSYAPPQSRTAGVPANLEW